MKDIDIIHNSNRRNLVLLVLLLLAVVAAYSRVASFPFLEYDDQAYILDNEVIRHWSSLSFIFGSDVWQGRMDMVRPYYRPLFVSWTLFNFKLYGLHAALWHLSSLAIYLIAVWLGWKLARKLTGNDFAAFAAAALFALHPTHVESVAWLTGVVEPLTSIFFFGAFLLYMRWRESGDRRWLFTCGFVSLLALFTKEAGAALLLLIPCYEALFPVTEAKPGDRRKRWMILIPTMAGVGLFYAGARTFALWGMHSRTRQPLAAVLSTAPLVLTTYLKQAIWPVRLALWYDLRVVTALSFTRFYLPLIVCLGYLGFTLWALRRNRQIAFAMIWWLATLGPLALAIQGFFEFDFIHDRYGFLGSYGLCLAAGLAISYLSTSMRRLQLVPAAALAIIVAVFGWLTAAQTHAWSSNLAVYSHPLEVFPDSYAAQEALANYLVRSGKTKEGLKLFQKAAATHPDMWEVSFNAGSALARFRRFADADPLLQRAIELNPKETGVYIEYADVLGRQNRTAEALRVLQQGLPLVDHPERVRIKMEQVQDPDFYRKSQIGQPRL